MAGDKVKGLPNRGETFYGPLQTIDTANYGGSVGLEGQIAQFKDTAPATTYGINASQRSSTECTVVFVRNTAGATILGKRLMTWATGYRGKRTAGYARLEGEEVAGVSDEWLGTDGVRNGDMYYLAVKGPSLCMTDLAGGANNLISEGDPLYALTAVTSGSTTSGRVAPFAATSTLTNALSQILNRVGRAMSAKTTAQTNGTVLVDLELMKG